jgi:DNA adenine methylase
MLQTQLQIFDLKEVISSSDNIIYHSKPSKKVFIDKVSPPIRYPGSKFRASKLILPHLDIEHTEYREPFLGSGAIFFTKKRSNYNWLNDIDNDLIITFQIISDKQQRNELICRAKNFIPSKEAFDILKAKKYINPIDIAYRYFVINRTAYSGIMKLPNWGFHPIKSVQPDKWPTRIMEAGIKLEGSQITKLDFAEVILSPSENDVLIFVDPPYFLADQKRAYLHSFTMPDHIRLMEVLKQTNHKFCLTYDNCNEVKELYSWANIHEYNWMYHTANSNTTTRKMGRELIITNY